MRQCNHEVLRNCVGQVCNAIGFQGLLCTPLEVLADLLHRYLTEVSRLTHRNSEHFGRTEPNLDDLGLAFLDMGTSMSDLEEYINNVDCSPYPHLLPPLPVARTSNLNFLKPGAREIVSRPIHVHEHLPPMYPEREDEELDVKVNLDEGMGDGSSPNSSPQPAVKRSSDSDSSPTKKAKYSQDDEGQPVREIVSVMMTTSGFISSGREGKLPEAGRPNVPMAAPRSYSPSGGVVGKKKLNVEKLIRHKNNQSLMGLTKPQRPFKVKPKEGKGLKIPKVPPGSVPPGVSAPPKLKMPTPKAPTPKIPAPKPTPPAPKASPPKMAAPKIPAPKASSTPKVKFPKAPKSETKRTPNPKPKEETRKAKKERDPGKKNKESKKERDPAKAKEGKKEKDSKKEAKKEMKKENKKEKERERELIMALASSSAVTVTSIPAPGKSQQDPSTHKSQQDHQGHKSQQDHQGHKSQQDHPEKSEGKSKLSIFKKINKAKDHQGADRDAPPSRDSSPDLMIDETPSRARRPEEVEVQRPGGSPPGVGSPPYRDDLSPPGTPSTPRTPELPPHKARKGKAKRARKESSKGAFSPGRREACDFEASERPKTPEAGLPLEELVPSAPFPMHPFPSALGFIPPFSRFPFIHPFAGPRLPPPHHPMPDLRHPFLPRPPPKRQLDDDHMLDDPESLERPLTPRHTREASPLPIGHPSPLRSPSPIPMPVTPPRPRTPAHSPPPMPKMKADRQDKTEKEKKKEHKKDKKEKEKEKDKVKKKKEKKDKEKEKEKSDKKKEREKTKQDKREKKVKKEKDDGGGSARITVKLPPSSSSGSPPRLGASRPTDATSTPKLHASSGAGTVPAVGPSSHFVNVKVIKPVMKHEDDPPAPKPPASSSSSHEDQPGSPEIAKFSALITRPPRSQQKKGESPPVVPVLKIKDVQNPTRRDHPKGKEAGSAKEVPPLKIKNPAAKPQAAPKPGSGKSPGQLRQSPTTKLPTTAKPLSMPKPPAPKVNEDKKAQGSKKIRDKKEKKEKKPKDSSGGAPLPSGPAGAPATAGSSAEASLPPQAAPPPPAPVTSPPPEAPKSKRQEHKGTGLLTETVGPIGHFVDDQGNEVWICPTCGKQDDGSPMIGCDTCDDWYHWVCVGIQVPPNDDVNWYCPRCLSQHKQRGPPPEKKKRGRKKK